MAVGRKDNLGHHEVVRLLDEFLLKQTCFSTKPADTASQLRFLDDDIICVSSWSDFNSVLSNSNSQTILTAVDVKRLFSNGAADQLLQQTSGEHTVGPVIARMHQVVCCFDFSDAALETVWPLSNFSGNEAQVRMIVDVVLQELCRRHRLQLSPEEAMPPLAPVSGVADYVLRRSEVAVAVVETKKCLADDGSEAWPSLFLAAAAQTLALLAGCSLSSSRGPSEAPFGLVTDSRRWLLLHAPRDGPPVFRRWPDGRLILEFSGPSDLQLLMSALAELLQSPA